MAAPRILQEPSFHLGPDRPMTYSFSSEILSALEVYISQLSPDDEPVGTDVQAAHPKLTGATLASHGMYTGDQPLATERDTFPNHSLPNTFILTDAHHTDIRDSFEQQNVFRSSCISQQSGGKQDRGEAHTSIPTHLQSEDSSVSRRGSTVKRWSLPFRRSRNEEPVDKDGAQPITWRASAPPENNGQDPTIVSQSATPRKRHSYTNFVPLQNKIKKAGTWTKKSLRMSRHAPASAPSQRSYTPPPPMPQELPTTPKSALPSPRMTEPVTTPSGEEKKPRPNLSFWTKVFGPFVSCTGH
ncbi:hypothetical protein IWQ62_001687 [Dispira parvispora]|uniref:Uncharacterized protein n=1 Tax=Dispira parvispora TaxID=1520584 RepID=A0A9W8E899_9FUNG|nr:hypothetical protein IWQ62_001687 [Dispira parvispora]